MDKWERIFKILKDYYSDKKVVSPLKPLYEAGIPRLDNVRVIARIIKANLNLSSIGIATLIVDEGYRKIKDKPPLLSAEEIKMLPPPQNEQGQIDYGVTIRLRQIAQAQRELDIKHYEEE